jgi:hypothetical protein
LPPTYGSEFAALILWARAILQADGAVGDVVGDRVFEWAGGSSVVYPCVAIQEIDSIDKPSIGEVRVWTEFVVRVFGVVEAAALTEDLANLAVSIDRLFHQERAGGARYEYETDFGTIVESVRLKPYRSANVRLKDGRVVQCLGGTYRVRVQA